MKNITTALLAAAFFFLAGCRNNPPQPVQPRTTPPAAKGPKVEINTTVEPLQPKGTEVQVGPGGVDVKVHDKKGNQVDIHKDK